MMIRLRLIMSSLLLWLGLKIAPHTLKPSVEATRKIIDHFTDELRTGRRYGVVIATWFIEPKYADLADELHEAALKAIYDKRFQTENNAMPEVK
jgi:hypothetical protein